MGTPAPPPAIRYVATKDGAKLAVATSGSGPVAVFVRGIMGSHLAAPGTAGKPWLQVLAPRLTVAAYDPRGCGLSERRLDQVTLEGCIEELECVVDALGPGPVALIGTSFGAPIAVHFAALHPQRVARLVLYGGGLRGHKHREVEAAMERLAHAVMAAIWVATGGRIADKAAFRRMLITRMCPGASDEEVADLDAGMEGRYTPEAASSYMDMLQFLDVSASAPQVRCPTLVFHANRDQVVPVEEATRMAAMIPGARFVLLDDDNHMPLASNPNWPAIALELRHFFGWPDDPAAAPVLTSRQLEVLRLIGQGCTDKQIGRHLAISPRTVEMHVAHAMRALGSKTRAEAATQAAQRGLMS